MSLSTYEFKSEETRIQEGDFEDQFKLWPKQINKKTGVQVWTIGLKLELEIIWSREEFKNRRYMQSLRSEGHSWR